MNDTPEDDPGSSENEQDEALNDTPRALLAPGGPLVAWTDWRKRHESSLTPHQQYDISIARPGGANVRVDPYGARPLSAFSPAACVVGRDALVAFQDAARGQSDIRVVRMRGGLRRGRARRVDDSGGRLGGNAWRPQLACSRGRVLAVWEDERGGRPLVFVARARARALR